MGCVFVWKGALGQSARPASNGTLIAGVSHRPSLGGHEDAGGSGWS